MKLLRRLLAGVALVLATTVVFGFSLPAIPAASSRVLATDFALNDSRGTSIKLSAYRGKVVLLDVWATWCTGCKEEMPWFMEFQTKYGPRGLRSIGVAMDDEGWEAVRPYLKEHPINYTIVTGDARFAKEYRVTAMPVTLLIDRKGRVADWHVGVVNKAEWEEEIHTLLKER